MSDIQFDNQLYTRQSFDFPVILIGQEKKPSRKINILGVPMETLLKDCNENALVIVDLILESWHNYGGGKKYTGM